jgi:hypothetical protein
VPSRYGCAHQLAGAARGSTVRGAMSGSVLIERPGVGLVVSRASLAARVSARLRFATLDEALAAGADPESRPALTLRAGRLIAPRMRRGLAHSLRRFVAMARTPPSQRAPWPVAQPLLPVGGPHVVDAAEALLELADRLERPGPVDARGVALACVLLTDGGGPLHRNQGADALAAAARAAGEALAPHAPAPA